MSNLRDYFSPKGKPGVDMSNYRRVSDLIGLLRTKMAGFKIVSAHEAEVLAILWAFVEWQRVKWSTDVAFVVKEVVSIDVAEGWNSRYALLHIVGKIYVAKA